MQQNADLFSDTQKGDQIMPIYEYYCQDCNTKFELIRDIAKANDPAKCQKCGSKNTKRLISKFYSQGSSENSSSSGCSSCSGGNCSSCGH